MRKLAVVAAMTIGTASFIGSSTPIEARPAKHVNAIWPCQYFIPHSGDDLFFWAWNNESSPYVDTADCIADHTDGSDHLYCVIEWHHFGDGTPINPPQYTWEPGSLC